MSTARTTSPTRSSGLLLHLTSLPGPGGIGDLGDHAYEFLAWLADAGQSLWQILPINPTGYGDSPYNATSSYAGNRLLISIERLARDLGLAPSALAEAPAPATESTDYETAARWKTAALRRAWTRLRDEADSALALRFREFADSATQPGWLADWVLFAALKAARRDLPWWRWEPELRSRRRDALRRMREDLRSEIEFETFVQFVFFEQWNSLRHAAGRLGIRLLGDLPIYVAHDSADVWAHQELFDLDQSGRALTVAGVPPDYFSATGQRWGNPTYRWDRHLDTNFSWWLGRLSWTLGQFDLLRLDHFRGFAAFWSVPAAAADARSGRWIEAPGQALFDALRREIGPPPLIAEDLGVITDDVEALRRENGFPGMKVLQFAFDGPDSEHLPHHHTRDSVVYTGTHDNDTAAGWSAGLTPTARRRATSYLDTKPAELPAALLRAAWTSVADLAVVPAQDLLGLGSSARMNLPGRPAGNWRWRLAADALDQPLAERLRQLTEVAGRLHAVPDPPASSGAGTDSPRDGVSAPAGRFDA